MNTEFEQEIEPITGRRNTMGIEELLLERARSQGREEEKVKNENLFVENLLRDTDFDNEKIASLVGVSVTLMKKIRVSQTAGK